MKSFKSLSRCYKAFLLLVSDRRNYLQEDSRQLQKKAYTKRSKFFKKHAYRFSWQKKKRSLNVRFFTNWYLNKNWLIWLIYLNRQPIFKRLSGVSRRPVTSNCGAPTEKFPECLDPILKPIMQESWSYIKYSGDLLRKNWKYWYILVYIGIYWHIDYIPTYLMG